MHADHACCCLLTWTVLQERSKVTCMHFARFLSLLYCRRQQVLLTDPHCLVSMTERWLPLCCQFVCLYLSTQYLLLTNNLEPSMSPSSILITMHQPIDTHSRHVSCILCQSCAQTAFCHTVKSAAYSHVSWTKSCNMPSCCSPIQSAADEGDFSRTSIEVNQLQVLLWHVTVVS